MTSKPETKKQLTNYNYYVSRSARQASDYKTTTEFLINYIKNMYKYRNNIAKVLKELMEVNTTPWKLTIQVSTQADAWLRNATKTHQYKIKFKSDYNAYHKQTTTRTR